MLIGTLVAVGDLPQCLWYECKGGLGAVDYTRPNAMGVVVADDGGAVVQIAWNFKVVAWAYRDVLNVLSTGE